MKRNLRSISSFIHQHRSRTDPARPLVPDLDFVLMLRAAGHSGRIAGIPGRGFFPDRSESPHAMKNAISGNLPYRMASFRLGSVVNAGQADVSVRLSLTPPVASLAHRSVLPHSGLGSWRSRAQE